MSIDAIGIDDDLRIFDVGMDLTSSYPLSKPVLSSPESSIQSAQKKEIPSSHQPVLSPPSQHMLAPLLDSLIDEEEFAKKEATFFEGSASKNVAKIEQINIEMFEALTKEAANNESRSTWDTFASVSQYISSIGTIALGAATGGATAPFLIASGVLGLTIGVIHDTSLLDSAVSWYTKSEELQKKISNNIHTGAFCLQLGLGLAGGISAWRSGALAAAQVNSNSIKAQAASILTGSSMIASAGAHVGASYYEWKLAYLSKDIRNLEDQLTVTKLNLSQNTKTITEQVDSLQQQANCATSSIQNLSNLID